MLCLSVIKKLKFIKKIKKNLLYVMCKKNNELLAKLAFLSLDLEIRFFQKFFKFCVFKVLQVSLMICFFCITKKFYL